VPVVTGLPPPPPQAERSNAIAIGDAIPEASKRVECAGTLQVES